MVKIKNNNSVIAYTYDFLSLLLEDSELKEYFKEIILFGSVAKGTSDEKSDIDLFFNIKNKEKISNIEETIKRILKSFEVKAERTWKIKNISFPISFIVGNLDEEKWKSLKEEIISSGVVLYGNYKEFPKGLIQKYMMYYSLVGLSRKDKMRFIRAFSGYSIKKNKKEYKQEGMLKKISGLKISQNVIMIEKENLLLIKQIFSKFKIKYHIVEIWIKQ